MVFEGDAATFDVHAVSTVPWRQLPGGAPAVYYNTIDAPERPDGLHLDLRVRSRR